MILEGLGNPHRGFRNVQLVGGLLRRLLDAALDFADVVEIFAQADAVAGIELALQPRHLVGDGIENAAVLLFPRKALR